MRKVNNESQQRKFCTKPSNHTHTLLGIGGGVDIENGYIFTTAGKERWDRSPDYMAPVHPRLFTGRSVFMFGACGVRKERVCSHFSKAHTHHMVTTHHHITSIDSVVSLVIASHSITTYRTSTITHKQPRTHAFTEEFDPFCSISCQKKAKLLISTLAIYLIVEDQLFSSFVHHHHHHEEEEEEVSIIDAVFPPQNIWC